MKTEITSAKRIPAEISAPLATPAPLGQCHASRPLIIVIEDDYRSSLALTMLIDDWGYSCMSARSSREAVQTLGNRLSNVAAIVTDLEIDGHMRGINDALAIADAVGRAIPTIVTTGYGEFARNTGTFPVLRKPFDPDVLREWLRSSVN